jgi:hypothetical protein
MLMSLLAVAASQESKGSKPEYLFLADRYVAAGTGWVGLVRQNALILGNYDKAGNFIEDRKIPPMQVNQPASGGHVEVVNFPHKPPEGVYECRSGRLINPLCAPCRGGP